MHIPFVYSIKFIDPLTNKIHWYIGSKYAKGCKPSDLWTSYFTSSKKIAKLLKSWGPKSFSVKIVKTFPDPKSAREFEERLVRRAVKNGLRLQHELLNANIPNTGWQTFDHRGISKDPNAIKKMVQTRRSRGTYDGGAKHPRARKFLLISPSNLTYEINGTLKTKCKELNLSWQTLFNNQDKVIILDRSKYKNLARLTPAFFNTIGWKLQSNS